MDAAIALVYEAPLSVFAFMFGWVACMITGGVFIAGGK